MILSIIIPVYNEERTVIEVLEKIKKNSSNLFKYEIIVIDDGSTDQSRILLEKNSHLYDELILNETNKGNGQEHILFFKTLTWSMIPLNTKNLKKFFQVLMQMVLLAQDLYTLIIHVHITY